MFFLKELLCDGNKHINALCDLKQWFKYIIQSLRDNKMLLTRANSSKSSL